MQFGGLQLFKPEPHRHIDTPLCGHPFAGHGSRFEGAERCPYVLETCCVRVVYESRLPAICKSVLSESKFAPTFSPACSTVVALCFILTHKQFPIIYLSPDHSCHVEHMLLTKNHMLDLQQLLLNRRSTLTIGQRSADRGYHTQQRWCQQLDKLRQSKSHTSKVLIRGSLSTFFRSELPLIAAKTRSSSQ